MLNGGTVIEISTLLAIFNRHPLHTNLKFTIVSFKVVDETIPDGVALTVNYMYCKGFSHYT